MRGDKRQVKGEPIRVRHFWAMVVLIWVVSVVLHLLAATSFGNGTPSGEQGAEMVLYTNDSGYHGYQAQAFLGLTEPRGPYTLAAILPALCSLVTPFSLDSVLFFLPALLAPLIVFPLAWLGRRWIADLPALGLALISSFLTGYYQRSHAGYYDTDILNIFFPLLIIVMLIKLTDEARLRWLLYAVLLALLYDWWYGSARAMLFGLAGGFFLHTLFVARQTPSRWQALVVFGLAVAPLPLPIRLAGLVVLIFGFYVILPRLASRYIVAAWVARQTVLWLVPLVVLGLVWLALGGAAQLQSQVAVYLVQSPTIDIQAANKTFHFAAATGTIIESSGVPTNLYLKTFAGQPLLGWVSLLGLAVLIWRVREAILFLPFVLLGVIGFFSGIRFSIYLAPVALFGFVWGVYRLAWRFFSHEAKFPGLICLIFLLLPAWFHGTQVLRWNRKVIQPVFDTQQVKALRMAAQGAHGAAEAWAFSWWDYGWPLWQYGHWKAVIDNATQGDADSYLVSRAFGSTNQSELAGLALLMSGEKARQPAEQAIRGLLNRYGEVEALITAAKTVQQTSTNEAGRLVPALVVFPWQMRYLLHTIDTFSRRDPATGRPYKENVVWMLGRVVERKGPRLAVAETSSPRSTQARPRFYVSEESGLLESGTLHEGQVQLARLVRVSWQGEKRVVSEKLYPSGGLADDERLTLVEDEHGVVLMHERYYRSNYVQMSLLGRVDPALFEVVYQDSRLLLARTRLAGQ